MSQTKMQAPTGEKPARSAIVLITLILGAITANLNLSIANVALPDIGKDLGASQVQLTMVASMFTLGLAATVLYLGALGDRYGRKILLLAGCALSVPAAIVSAYAPSVEVLIVARLIGGFAAGMLFPTTLSLISALWRGSARTKAIALWSGIGGAAAALGGVAAGLLLEDFWWGSVFLITVPLAVAVFIAALIVIPSGVGEESSGPVDHIGGVLSVIAVASLVLGIQSLPNGVSAYLVATVGISLVTFVLLFVRLRRAANPLVDLKLASVPTFWVAFVGGTVSFGSLVAAMFLGQQFVQNVLHYDTLKSALIVLPCSIFLVVSAPISAKMIMARGSRPTLLSGMSFIALGFLVMIIGWRDGAGLWVILLAFAVLGVGVGLTSTPASRSLMTSLPTSRAGMGSAFTDLSRDFGGAIMQAVMGTILAVVYSDYLRNVAAHLSPEQASQFSQEATDQILSSYESAEVVAASYPPNMQESIINAAAEAFSAGKSVAYVVGLLVTILAIGLVWWKYPKKEDEIRIFAEIEDSDPALHAPV